jgi:diguanylate cyclase (GGDEF)-like protein/PAS domain S-box-containing protein
MERGSPAMPALRQIVRVARSTLAGPALRLVPAGALVGALIALGTLWPAVESWPLVALCAVTGAAGGLLAGRLRSRRRTVTADVGPVTTALRAERDLYHQVIASATADAIFTTGEGGVITFFSDGAERLTGYTAAEVVGVMHGIDLHVGDEIASVARELGVEPGRSVFTTLAQSGADTREWTLVRKDGSQVRVAHTVTTHHDDRGNLVGFVGVAHDISARHRSEQALRQSEERFRALTEHAPVGIVQTDEHANCWYANRRFCELVGRTESEVHGAGWLEALHRDDRAGLLDRWSHTLESGDGFDGEFRVVLPDGRKVDVRATAGPIREDDGRVSGFVITTQDISERVGAQQRLTESQELFRNTLENVALAAVQLDTRGVVVYCNPHLAAMLGRPAEAVVGCDWFTEFVPQDRAASREDYARMMRGELELPHNENELITAGGERRVMSWSSIIRHDIDGAAVGVISLGEDVTERRQTERRVSHLAYHDDLTGLPNRTSFADHLAGTVADAERGDAQIAVLFCDIDAFKLVNDSLGHAAGDELLRLVATRLRAVTRAADMIARQSGDEFLVLIRDTRGTHGDVDQLAEALAARIEHAISSPFLVDGHEIVIGVSVGKSVYPGDGGTAEELLHHADAEMYDAKAARQGRRVRGHGSDDPTRDLELAASLHHAIALGQLVLEYQPIVELETGAMLTVEALVRWDRGGELISPGLFLPAAERTGLLTPITHWVVEEAVRQLHRWKAVGVEVSIALNLPPAMLDRRMCDRLIRLAVEHELAPGSLTLELVESAMMDDRRLFDHLESLRAAGFRIAIDDFGSGHSSLARVAQLPVDVLKIDRSLIAQICESPRAHAIVRAIIAAADALDATVVAEGIETEQQRTALRQLGVRRGQGYLFARPMPARALAEWEPRAEAA